MFADLPYPDLSIRLPLVLLLPKAATGTCQSSKSSSSFAHFLLLWVGLHSGRRNERTKCFIASTCLSGKARGKDSREGLLSSSVALQGCAGTGPMSNVWLHLLSWCQEQPQPNISDANIWMMDHKSHYMETFFSWAFVIAADQNVKIEMVCRGGAFTLFRGTQVYFSLILCSTCR